MASQVTIREMENIVLGSDFGADIGNVINLNDLGDDMGMNMLANKSNIHVTNDSSSGTTFNIPSSSSNDMNVSVSRASSGGYGGAFPGLAEIDVTPFEPIQIDSTLPSAPIQIEIKKDTGLFSNSQTASGPSFSLPVSRDVEAEKKEKVEFLNKLQRLEAKGFPVAKHFTMDNSLDEVKQEYLRLVDARNLETSLRFQRQMLMGVVTGLEWMNGRFDPFDLKLEGWSESVHENVEDFDEVFEELYDKYKDRGKMAPEMRLMMALAGSGFMCHVSNSFFRTKMPSMDEVLRKNPELARQMAAAAASQAGPGFGNFMGMAMGVPPGGMGGMPDMAQQQQQQQPTPMPQMNRMPDGQPGAFFVSSRVPNVPQSVASVEPPRATARREMKGPSGVEDILKTFEEVRRAEVQEASMPAMPSGQPFSQPAVAMANEMQSLHSEDYQSQAGSTRTGGGRRKRRTAIPEGNTLSLNV